MEDASLIVGLGNPGGRYMRTRHNVGFMVVDRLAERWRTDWEEQAKFNSRLTLATVAGRRVWLCQPLTYMNVSGEAVGALVDFYKIPLDRLLVMVDDVNLPCGDLRLRPKGGCGGHHGLESVTQYLAGGDFARQRIGIGRPVNMSGSLTPHVLGEIGSEDEAVLGPALDRAADQAALWLTEGVGPAMNEFNRRLQVPREEKTDEAETKDNDEKDHNE